MKKVLPLFILLSAHICFGQKVDLDKYNFNASYLELPKASLDTSFRTFFVEFDASPSILGTFEGDDPEDYVYISGWKRLSDNGHVKIITRLDDVIIEKGDVKERVEILKDKNGKETGKRSHYYLELVYTFSASAKLTDYKGNLVSSYSLANRENRKTYNTKEFSSFNDAFYFYKFKGFSFGKEIARNESVRALQILTNTLNYNFGFTQRTVTDFMWILDSKKHPEYNAHRKAWTTIKQAMFKMSADEPLDEVREQLQPVIKYYQDIKRKYSSNSKGDRKIRYASFFNLAKIYYYLDEPDAAMKEASELMVNEFDEKDGRRLEAAATELKNILKANKVTSRHFSIQSEQFQGPSIVSAGK